MCVFNAPLAYYGEMILERTNYPTGIRGDIWYYASLQLRVIDNVLSRGRDKLQGDLTEVVHQLETSQGSKRFNDIGAEASIIFLFVSPLFCNTVMAQTYGVLEIALSDLCRSYDLNWLDLYNNERKKRWSTILKAKDFLNKKGLVIDKKQWDEIDLWRGVRNDIIHNVGRADKIKLDKYRTKLGIAIEISQNRIMLDPNMCIGYLELVDQLINNIFKQVPII